MTRAIIMLGVITVTVATVPYIAAEHPRHAEELRQRLSIPVPDEWEVLFFDDFESGSADAWHSNRGWRVVQQGDDHVFLGTGHNFATLTAGREWTNYIFRASVQCRKPGLHLNYRHSNYGRYFVGFRPERVSLHKEEPWGTFYDLRKEPSHNPAGRWHQVEIIGARGYIRVFIDGRQQLDFADASPLTTGTIAFETLEGAECAIDDVLIVGGAPPKSPEGFRWCRTGGPCGGLGYDVRIHPHDKNIMFVTDNPSGNNKSYDAGNTWGQRNDGITTRTGPSRDGVPVFSLTIASADPDIVWAGTQSACGVYKSTDCGETWTKKKNGITESNEITIRGFGIHPHNPDIVLLGAEITTGILGREFDKAKGKIYKTDDGGDHWRCVWQGASLARFVLFDPHEPNIAYASTGIFDREAFNNRGCGLLKSIDGGETWTEINNGIPDRDGYRFVGFLEMHPHNPKILYAASGCNATGNGGVFRTTNGGASWQQLLSDDIFTAVTISPSHPNIVYAGTANAFYRSEDAGRHWQKFNRPQDRCWGPPGIRAGVPISVVVDPDDPYTLFANNYGGGVFKSTDGARTWLNSSTGYTGAHMHSVAVDPTDPSTVYAVGRSGPFKSTDAGQTWSGLVSHPATSAEWNTIAVNPHRPEQVFLADEFNAGIFKSDDAGATWRCIYQHPKDKAGPFTDRDGFKAVAFAPSDPHIIYAGMRKGRRTIDGDFPPTASYGIYRSTDGGESWTSAGHGLGTAYLNINCIAVHPHNPQIAYAGTWVDGIYRTTNGGKTWIRKSNGLQATDVRALAINPEHPQTVYAGLGEGIGIFKTTNGGELWSESNAGVEIECPAYLLPLGRAEFGFSVERAQTAGGDYYSVPWTAIWDIAIDPTNPQTIFAADHRSGVYLSTNGGANWLPLTENLTTKAVTSLDISTDGRVLYAGTEGEGVFRLEVPQHTGR